MTKKIKKEKEQKQIYVKAGRIIGETIKQLQQLYQAQMEGQAVIFACHNGSIYTQKAVDELLKATVDELKKAYGGCTDCYGKGYATTKVQAGHRRATWELDPIRPCTCDRGKQIKRLMENGKI